MGRGIALMNLENMEKPKFFFDSTKTFESYIGENGLPSNYINCIKIVDGGALIGTKEGLAFFSQRLGKIIKPDLMGIEKFHFSVNDILLDYNDTILATNNGLYKVENKKIVKINYLLATSEVLCIKKSNNKYFIGTTKGLFILDNLLKIQNSLTDYNFLPHREVLTIFTDSKENLWVGTSSGCVKIAKNDLIKQVQNPKLIIHRIQEGSNILFANYSPSIKSYPNHIVLKEPNTTLKVLCSSDYILTGYECKYIFSLINGRDTLNFQQNSPEFTTPVLSTGNYTLIAKMEINKTYISKAEMINIVVPYPQFLKWYYILFYLTIFTILIMFIIWIRTRSIEKRNSILETEVENRTNEIKQKMKEIEELSRARAMFINFFAHDLTNSISNIQRGFELIEKGFTLNSPFGKYNLKTYLNFCFTRLINLIRQVLMMGQIESSKVVINNEWFNINEAILKVIKEFSFHSFEKNITINTKLDDDKEIFSDKSIIEFIFQNLLSNALKFSYPNSEVYITTSYLNEKHIIEFIDNGPGFKQEDFPLLFLPFQKLSAQPTGSESSTGLGLWISKSLLKLLGGSISIENHEPNGAKVTITLP